MNLLKKYLPMFSILMAVAILIAPLNEAIAQKGRKRNTSVRQSHKRPTHRPSHHPPNYRHPPSNNRPHRPHKPPQYRHPRPPRYRGHYYRNYNAWRAVAGFTAVIAIGTMLSTPPPAANTVIIHQNTYYVHDNVYYERVLSGNDVMYQVVPKP